MDLSLHPLTQALAVAYSYGPWLVFAALAWRFVLPRLKGGL